MSDLAYIYRHISPEAATVEEIIRGEIRAWLENTTTDYLKAFRYDIECNATDQAISEEDWDALERLQSCHAVITELLKERES